MTTQEHRVPMSDPTIDERREPTGPLSVSQDAAPNEVPSDGSPAPHIVDPQVQDPQAEDAEVEDLFADDELTDLRGRWASVQATFVDDPRDCVHKADDLVSDLVDQLTTGFARARTRLEEQWARGEEASTEDLRLALMHYREFFQRLLAV